MNGYISRYATKYYVVSFTSYYMILILSDYLVLSEFSLALLDDSGWYEVDYASLHNLKQNPLKWGKGKYLCVSS